MPDLWGDFKDSILEACDKVCGKMIGRMLVDVVTKFARGGALCELLYDGDLALMSETINRLRNKFLKWKEAFESKGL